MRGDFRELVGKTDAVVNIETLARKLFAAASDSNNGIGSLGTFYFAPAYHFTGPVPVEQVIKIRQFEHSTNQLRLGVKTLATLRACSVGMQKGYSLDEAINSTRDEIVTALAEILQLKHEQPIEATERMANAMLKKAELKMSQELKRRGLGTQEHSVSS